MGQLKNIFGSTDFKLSGKAWHNVVDLSSLSFGLKKLSEKSKKSYSFVLKFKNRPCGKIVGSSQWDDFFPSISHDSVLIIEVSPMDRESSGVLSTSIDISDSLEEILRKVEIASDTDINDTIQTLNVGIIIEIFSRFQQSKFYQKSNQIILLNFIKLASDLELERFIDRLIGFNQHNFSVESRVILLKALSTLFPNSYALEAAQSLIINVEHENVSALKQALDGTKCSGYFDLYSLIHELSTLR